MAQLFLFGSLVRVYREGGFRRIVINVNSRPGAKVPCTAQKQCDLGDEVEMTGFRVGDRVRLEVGAISCNAIPGKDGKAPSAMLNVRIVGVTKLAARVEGIVDEIGGASSNVQTSAARLADEGVELS
jgi:hypothetical protein